MCKYTKALLVTFGLLSCLSKWTVLADEVQPYEESEGVQDEIEIRISDIVNMENDELVENEEVEEDTELQVDNDEETEAALEDTMEVEEVQTESVEQVMFSVIEDADMILVHKGAVMKEDKIEDSRTVALAKEITKAHVLTDVEDGWVYVESGNARGFIKEVDIIDTLISSEMMLDDSTYPEFSLIIKPSDNKALTYTDITSDAMIIDGIRMKASAVSMIKESMMEGGRPIGKLDVNSICYVLEDFGDGWAFVESGDVRGFVETKTLLPAGGTASANEKVAEELVPSTENMALFYTMKSTKSLDSTARERDKIVNFALQFVGNPYVWGGTSLTNGADCSGFVQSVYANFGIYLPRVACDQAVTGQRISISEAKPGDLVFYSSNGYVYHVAMYIGDGLTVQAANSRAGIITCGVGNACWATNVLG